MTTADSRRVLTSLTSVAIPFGVVLLALFLRTYRLEIVAWVPDSYDRLAATKRLLAGEFPISRIYPPGVSLLMAPFFAVFPKTLDTMQAVIVISGVCLAAIGYFWMLRLTGER